MGRSIPLSIVDEYVAAVEAFLKQNNGPMDAATLSCYVLELQHWLTEHPAGLETSQIEALTRYALKSFALDFMETPKAPFVPVHNRPDPFRTLGIMPGSSKAEIMAAMLKRVREEPQNMAKLRRAQSEIFDPERALRLRFFQNSVYPLPKELAPDA